MTMLAQMAYAEPVADIGLPLPKPDSTGDELFRMGLLYSTGQGGAPLDYVSAHMLFNLAAMRGSIEAKVYRKELSQEMDPADVAEAQRAAREWLAHG
jgi:TPR repeat protein